MSSSKPLRRRVTTPAPPEDDQNDNPPALHRESSPPLDAKSKPAPSRAAVNMIDLPFILSLVFGGCCTNVWAYEQLLRQYPRIGSALTFSQMLFITVQALPSFLERPEAHYLPRLKPRQVPLRQWALQVLVLATGSLMNNWVFAFNVPLTVQIVFRSAGLAVSMLFGYVFLNRRYSLRQITSVALVSAGVIMVTLSRPSLSESVRPPDVSQYALGIAMLSVSLVLTGVLGILQEQTYKKYGPCWREGVFYTHFLSLPVFIFLAADVQQGLIGLTRSNRTTSNSILILAINLVSQLVCVSGVNRLSSQVSSVSTNLVLTTRKALSLCFSIWWFNSGWNLLLLSGALMVFAGSMAFSL